MPPKRLLLVLAAVAGVALATGAILLARGDPAGDAPADVRAELAPCAGTRSNDCYLDAMNRLVEPEDDPRPVVQRISDFAWRDPEFLLANCHGLMHTVGREYAAEHDVTLERIVDYLPRTNDPGCPAGFAHGLISGVAPQIDASRPEAQAGVCRREPTRYRRYSCVHGFGHAFMRIANERVEPALDLCRGLGADAPDCAQGVYHDYWFSIIGFDGTRAASSDPVRDPRELCNAQPAEFVRPCWYRAFVDTRPSGLRMTSADDIDGLCAGLAGVQRAGCVTAGSVIGPVNPAEQLDLCAAFRGVDAVSCLHGVKVQNLLRRPRQTYVAVIKGCDAFAGATRLECYRWLGKTFGVLTNGAFRAFGCRPLDADARRACGEGVRAMDEPLVTFS
jgi:hypothetical protein